MSKPTNEQQEKHWAGIQRRIEEYSKTYPEVFIHLHHEVVPSGCTSPYEKDLISLEEE